MSGLSVLLAVGVTTGGARLLAGRTSLTLDQPTTACPISENCAALGGPYGTSDSGAAGTPAPGAPTGDPAGTGQEDPGRFGAGDNESRGAGQGDGGQDDTAQSDTTQDSAAQDSAGHDSTGKNGTGQDGPAAAQATQAPTPAPTSAASAGPDRDHAAARTRTRGPSSTAAPRASSHASPRVGDAAALTAPRGDTEHDARNDAADTAGTVPGETALDDTGNGEDGAAGAVWVRFTVTHRDDSGYAARLTVRNEGPALPAWTIRLVVGGQVTAVDGADWWQEADTLTLSSQSALAEGGAVTLTIRADGASAAPAGCVLTEGRCEVTDSRPSRRRG